MPRCHHFDGASVFGATAFQCRGLAVKSGCAARAADRQAAEERRAVSALAGHGPRARRRPEYSRGDARTLPALRLTAGQRTGLPFETGTRLSETEPAR